MRFRNVVGAAALLAAAAAVDTGAAVRGHIDPNATTTELRVIDEEAAAALAILDAENEGRSPIDAEWDRLFISEPYKLLKRRAADYGSPFTDAEFKDILASPEVQGRRASFHTALDRWRSTDLHAAIGRARAYLPEGTPIHATIYPVVKRSDNSFVYTTEGEPGIFFYLDGKRTSAQWENLATHELHHIGIAAACKGRPEPLDARLKAVAKWIGAFGEGIAMLAAAGSPRTHPQAVMPAADRERWDQSMRNYRSDFAQVRTFFDDVISGRLTGDAVDQKAIEFYGIQGPWYTVGWKMASLIELKQGRPKLIATFCKPGQFLAAYNRAAAGTSLPKWPDSLIVAVSK
jgi:hypothetical protein